MYRLATISASELWIFVLISSLISGLSIIAGGGVLGIFQHFHWLGQLVGRTKSPMAIEGHRMGHRILDM